MLEKKFTRNSRVTIRPVFSSQSRLLVFCRRQMFSYTFVWTKDMLSSSAPGASGSLIRPLICGLLVILSLAGVRAAQNERSPGDLLKEAESLHKAGKLDRAIEDYRLFLKQYPDVFQVRSD